MSLVWISKPAVLFALLFQRKPCHSRYSTIALLLCFSVLLSWFQPIFVLFVTISAILCHCFKVMSSSEFYLNRAPFRLRVVPHLFSGVIFTRARVSLALLSLRKKWGTTCSLGCIIIWIINNKWNMLTCGYTNSMFSFEHCIICFFYLEIACLNLFRYSLFLKFMKLKT